MNNIYNKMSLSDNDTNSEEMYPCSNSAKDLLTFYDNKNEKANDNPKINEPVKKE